MQITLNPNSIDDYRLFLRIKSLPTYQIRGRLATFPDEYIGKLGLQQPPKIVEQSIALPSWMFDYQLAITEMAIRKQKFCLFVECGLGKTAIFLAWAQYVLDTLPKDRCVLIVSPLMVVLQTMGEATRFFGEEFAIEQVSARDLPEWLICGKSRLGITNYEAIRPELRRGRLGALIIDESSMLKSHYGKWGTKLLELGRGLDWKLAATGTPAPNDRIEYANHAVFMDAFPTVNSFLAKFFVNRSQKTEKWVLKRHAVGSFFQNMSAWSIFVTNPATYGWYDHADDIPPIHIHEHDVPLTEAQAKLAYQDRGFLFQVSPGGITSRSVLSQIAKGNHRGEAVPTEKPGFIRELVETWPEESTLIWCRFNAEQKRLEEEFPDAASITGATPLDARLDMIGRFKSGEMRVMISKPKILGFGLNLQKATRQVFSACEDSYESFYQAVKRSNRVGSTRPLNVHLPVTDIERAQMENVMRKMYRVQQDTEEQERMFRRQCDA